MNLAFGFLSIISSIEGNFVNAAFFIILALIADSFDGKVARRIKAVSDIGVEFDSLADLVSFGVAPGVLLYLYIFEGMRYGIFIPILMAVCAALRLARFNVHPRQDAFVGIPAPAFGFFSASYIISGISLDVKLSAIIFALASLSMISTVKYPSFKYASKKVWALLALICFGILVLTFIDVRFISLPFLLYIFIGPFVIKWMK